MTAHTPNLPALIADLPGDHTRAPQTEFTRERQVAFLENLSLTGSVRSAAVSAQVSHQTAYRARRSQGPFRIAWDAAMVQARANAEAVLAARAIDGVEEKVFYHGEQVDVRVRYSDRLLLAHLARLDKLTADADTQAFAEDWDGAMERFARGEDPVAKAPAPQPQPEPEKPSPGPCNTRSMSNTGDDDGDLLLWFEMNEARPAEAPPLGLMGAPLEVFECQAEVYSLGDPDWWRYGEGYACFEQGEDGVWRVEPAGPNDTGDDTDGEDDG